MEVRGAGLIQSRFPQRVVTAGMLACRGRVQCEGEVIHIHLIAEHLIDL